MAKSMRSKWKRKMRAVKRVKSTARDLVKLNRLVALDRAGQEDFVMKDLVTVTDASQLAGKTNDGESSGMDVDPRFNRKTLKDENGQYPGWMNQRAMQKRKSKAKQPKRIKHKLAKKRQKQN
jgi:hypothetical protein